VSVVDVPRSGIESLFNDLARRQMSLDEVNEVKAMLEQHPGDSPVYLSFGTKTVALGAEHAVNIGNVIGMLRARFGDAVSIR
jgi:chaperonin cofactor prefoldin